MPHLPTNLNYWNTPEGIDERLDMFTMYLLMLSFNSSLILYAEHNKAKEGTLYLQMSGPAPVCRYCQQYHKKLYRPSDFMPEFPSHPNCTHSYEAIII